MVTYGDFWDLSEAAKGKPSSERGTELIGTGFKGFGQHIDSVYQQAFFCDGINVAKNNQKDDELTGDDWALLKEWFSIDKLRENIAMDDKNPKKIIKSNETLLDVVTRNQGKKTLCGGNTKIPCDSYTETFDENHMYYVTLSQKPVSGNTTWTEYMTYPATARVTTKDGGNTILIVDLVDAADYYIQRKSDKSGYEACYAWEGGNTASLYHKPGCYQGVATKIHRIVAEPLE